MKQELILICTVNMLIQKEERKFTVKLKEENLKILLPELSKDAVIVMDNACYHRKKQLNEIAENNNITLIFLPPYSPELNPIEKLWANMKNFLRNFLHNFSSLDDAICSFFKVE